MNIADMVKAMYENQNTPHGMFKMILSANTSTNLINELENTIIDYTKLSSDNFAFTNISGHAQSYDETDGWRTADIINQFIPTYNASSGILSFNNKIVVCNAVSGNCTYTVILFCDISTCIKSNWKDFI